MPISYLFKGELLMFKAIGAVTVKEFYQVWDEITGDPSFQQPLDTLIDLREAQVDVPGQEIEDIVYRLKQDRFFNKIVFVAKRGSFTYAMGRMFCINAECAGCCSEIFLNMVDALAWLDEECVDDKSSAPIDAA
jgi:hypothetical protein